MTITTDHVLRNAAVTTPAGVQYLAAVTYRDEGTEFMTVPSLNEGDDRITIWAAEDVELHAEVDPGDPGHCAVCGDPLAWTGTPGSPRIHAWSGRLGLPERPYDHAAG